MAVISQKESTIVNLTDRQLQAMSLILSATTIEEGCRTAGISKQTFYNWMDNPDFKSELTRQRNEVIQEGLSNLKRSIKKAVDVLMDCLNSKDDFVKRRAANDLLTHCLRLREIEEVEDRLQALEEVIVRRKIYK
jgi:hypothetical protein